MFVKGSYSQLNKMSSTPQVVEGEASESDSEVEIEIGKTPTDGKVPQESDVQASVISGEASESDEDRLTPPLKGEAGPPAPPMSPNLKIYEDSILHDRLRQANMLMRCDLEVRGLRTIKAAYEKVASLTTDLLAVQESIRVTDSQLTLARARTRQIQEQLKNCHFQTALPTVKIV